MGLLLLISLASVAFSQQIPAKPINYVSDYADLLTPRQEATLNRLLRAYEDSTSVQLVVATFPDAQGYPVEEFTIRLAEQWKVGHKGRDNGILLAVFLKERKIRIDVGYGLEDKIPDAVAFQIIQNRIRPEFRQGHYYQGILAGVQALMQAAAGKFTPLKKRPGAGEKPFNWAAVIVFLIFTALILVSASRRRARGVTFGPGSTRRSSGSFWGGFGGFGGGGGGGGGFSGGGGSFGGGGATGSW